MAEDKTYTQEELDAAITKAVDKAVGDTEGLKQKVEDLIGDNKKLKADLRKTQDIKPEDVAALEHQVEELQGKLDAAEKGQKDAEKARDKAVKDLEAEQGFTQRLLIQDGLKTALIENGVKDPDFIDSLSAKFASGAKIVVDGEERKAMFGDKTLADHVKAWAGTDAGKKFVEAPANSGGGAQGGTDKGSGKTMTRAQHDEMVKSDPAAVRQFFSEGGKVVDQAA